jgi:PAS domain S-box-containing protein
MVQRTWARLSKWWLLLKITEKFSVIILLVLLIGVAEAGVSMIVLGIGEGAEDTALAAMAQNDTGFAEVQGQIDRTQQRVAVFLLLSNLVGVALIGLIIYAFAKNISAGVARLTNASALIHNGELDERMIPGSDEFEQIRAAISKLTDIIQDRDEALSESEARFSELITAAPHLVFIIQDGKFVYLNPACSEAFNYTIDGLGGVDFQAVVHPEDRPFYQERVQKLEGDANGLVEIRVLNRDGQILLLEIAAVQITHDHMPAVLWIGQDISRHRIMEKALIETEKLAGIGTLAAGIAHEINSPLQVVTGYSGSIRRDIEVSHPFKAVKLDQKIVAIERNAWRIAAIVQSLLAYARPAADQVGSCTLNDIVEEMLLLIEHQLSSWSNISIEKELAANLPPLRCDSNRITQVLINLLTNAADAMPDGGEIVIRTGFDEEIRQFSLQIADTGAGIPENLQNRVFDPFFTTKKVGKGTGLGLSIARGIVEAHGGSISLESQSNKGTTFTISLPQEPVESVSAYPVYLNTESFRE